MARAFASIKLSKRDLLAAEKLASGTMTAVAAREKNVARIVRRVHSLLRREVLKGMYPMTMLDPAKSKSEKFQNMYLDFVIAVVEENAKAGTLIEAKSEAKLIKLATRAAL